MNTSYFASTKIIKGDPRLVSISRKPPDWIKAFVPIYKPLGPSWDLVMSYKSGEINQEEYTIRYYNEILNNLDPTRTYEELGEDSILLCYEKSGQFCHRRLIAKWFEENLNIKVTEL